METTTLKLILLYALDQMEIPVTKDTLNDMCCSQNNWLSYMTLSELLPELISAHFVAFYSAGGNEYYKITQEGRDCLNYFFTKIPTSIRNEIGNFIKKNRQAYKRKQEYFKDYHKNKDGSYTVNLRIVDPTCSKLEIKLNVSNRAEAITAFNKWNNCAGDVYLSIYKILIEGE